MKINLQCDFNSDKSIDVDLRTKFEELPKLQKQVLYYSMRGFSSKMIVIILGSNRGSVNSAKEKLYKKFNATMNQLKLKYWGIDLKSNTE